MTENDLSKYYKLHKEVEDLKRRIIELGVGVGSIKIKEINVSGSGTKESVQEKIAMLDELYTKKSLAAIDEYVKIENYIESVEDPELRTIMRFRFLDLLTWEEIAEKTYLERTTVAKKVRRYIKAAK